jgi:AsmA protein
MKRILQVGAIVGFVLAVLIAGLLVLPRFIPTEVYRKQIETVATTSLGREVRVTGDIRLSVFPRIEARAGAASIANPPGFNDRPFATIKELRAAVKLFPLLVRRVEIDEFVLVEPDIALVALEDGSNNWTFKPPQPRPQAEPDQPAPDIGAALGDVRIRKGAVSYEDRKSQTRHAFTQLDLKADMQALDKPLRVTASGLANLVPFKASSRVANPQAMIDGAGSEVEANLTTDLIETALSGTVRLGEAPAFDLGFEGDIPSVTRLADAFKVADLPARDALGRITARGRLTGAPGALTLAMDSARHESPLLNADFTGSAQLAQFITLDITANAEAPQLARLAQTLAIETPGDNVLGAAKASARITGQLGDLAFQDVSLAHDSDLLRIKFDGSARLATTLTFDGKVAIASPDLRKLAAATNATLPPGEVYKTFSLSGETAGGTDRVQLRNAVVQLDNLKGTGSASLDFGRGRPTLRASLRTDPLDVTPYALASGAPTEADSKDAWRKTPIDLSPLRLVDATLDLAAAGVTYQKFNFGPSDLGVTLKDGRLVADLRQTSLFGGAGGLSVIADGSGPAPVLALKAQINGLGLQPLMQASAGFNRLAGNGDLLIDITARGGTVADVMASLNGQGALNVRDGVISGVDFVQLVNVARTAAAQRQIPLSAFGANASTPFRNMKASFAVKDGVAAMGDMLIDASVMKVSGGGALDLGKQTLSLSLFPEFTDRAKGMNGYGLPLKLSGGWSGVNVSLDFDWLLKRATADAGARVNDAIEGELRKQVGDEFTRALGIGRGGVRQPAPQTPPAPVSDPAAPTAPEAAPGGSGTPETPAPEAAPPPPPKTAEELLREEAGKRLGGLLNRN